jgi:hypothetical protein
MAEIAALPTHIAPAPLADVMFDQLDWLLGHVSPACGPECEDCARLEQVKKILLKPFDAVQCKPRVLAA